MYRSETPTMIFQSYHLIILKTSTITLLSNGQRVKDDVLEDFSAFQSEMIVQFTEATTRQIKNSFESPENLFTFVLLYIWYDLGTTTIHIHQPDSQIVLTLALLSTFTLRFDEFMSPKLWLTTTTPKVE